MEHPQLKKKIIDQQPLYCYKRIFLFATFCFQSIKYLLWVIHLVIYIYYYFIEQKLYFSFSLNLTTLFNVFVFSFTLSLTLCFVYSELQQIITTVITICSVAFFRSIKTHTLIHKSNKQNETNLIRKYYHTKNYLIGLLLRQTKDIQPTKIHKQQFRFN